MCGFSHQTRFAQSNDHTAAGDQETSSSSIWQNTKRRKKDLTYFRFTLDHESVPTLLLNRSILMPASVKITMCPIFVHLLQQREIHGTR